MSPLRKRLHIWTLRLPVPPRVRWQPRRQPPVQWLIALAALSVTPFTHAQTAFTQVAYQRDVICGLTTDNRVICDATLNEQVRRVPEDLPPAQEVSAGRSAACAVLVSGGLQCWGRADFGLTLPPSGGEPYSSLSMSNTHACAINRDNGIECWGLPDNDRLEAPSGAFQQLSLGQQNACAVDLNGGVSCWGSNDAGSSSVPADLPAAQQVSATRAASCALLMDGSIQCWGLDLAVPAFGPYVDVQATASVGAILDGLRGDAAVCGIQTDGTLDCAFTDINDNQTTQIPADNLPNGLMVSDLSLSFSANNSQSGCFVETTGELNCFGLTVPDVFTLDGITAPTTTGLRADIYSTTTVELFWDGFRGSPFLVAGHEIQRNGEIIAFTQNASSYIVDDLVPGESNTFAVRQITADGLIGSFSDSITLTTNDLSGGDIEGPNNSDYQPPSRPFEPANVQAFVYDELIVELIWDRPATSAITGYEIRRNGVFVGFTNGTSYLEDLPAQSGRYHYDIIPVNQNDSSIFYGFSSIDVEVGSVCR